MPYRVEITPAADRQFGNLDKQTQRRVLATLEDLQVDPRPSGSIKLKGPQGYLRVRAGDYRVIYQILNERLVVVVLKIAHRREVYRGFENL